MKYYLFRMYIYDTGEVIEQKCFSENGDIKRARNNFIRRIRYGYGEKLRNYEVVLIQEYDVY